MLVGSRDVPRARLPFVLLLLSLCAFTRVGLAQLMPAEEKGLPPNSVFHGGDVDVVNLQNGNLHISIPIEIAAQRGGTTLKWAFVYDTQAWSEQYTPYTCSTPCTPAGFYTTQKSTNVASGWRLSSPFNWGISNVSSGGIDCATTNQTYQAYTNWAIIDPEGTQHSLPLRQETGPHCFGQTLAGPALDGSGLYYDDNAQVLYTKDGYRLSGSNSVLNAGQDRNGNQVTTSQDTLMRDLVTTSSGTDTIGPYTQYTINNSADGPLDFRVYTQSVSVKTDICASAMAQSKAITCSDFTQTYSLPSMLTLPTGKAYTFKYAANTPADLIELDLPTGAAITYQYTDFYQLKVNASQVSHPNVVGSRGVTQRTVMVNGQASVWTYSPGIITAKVTNPLKSYQVHTFSFVDATTPAGQQVQSPNVYEKSVAYYDNKGLLVKTTTNNYAAEYDPVNNTTANVRVTQTATVWPDGQTTAVQTDYETFSYPCVDAGGACTGTATRLNPTETRTYDYGSNAPGALLTKTDYCYLHTNNQSYTSLNIVDKATVVTVSDSSGAIAQTVNEYDGYGHTGQPMQSSGAIQHNATYGTAYTTRGNLTAVSKWQSTKGAANTNCATATTAFVTTTMQYDDTGNVVSTIDPKLYQTFYSFADSWANPTACVPNGKSAAFLTKITNAKGQFATNNYYACTGKIGTATDVNSKATTYAYDNFDRALTVTPPNLGLKTLCYSDEGSSPCYSASTLTSSQTDAMNGSTNMARTTLYDTLGRVVETTLADPSGLIKVDTQYDLDGHPYRVSNPYRSGDPVYWTTQLYDGIGRSAGVTRQDGASTSITYSGNVTTSTDEAGNQRNSQFDGLGRLTGVWEDPSGLNYETDYQYDALGDLRQATQKGGSSNTARVRSFTYDSLGQLLCAANPEISAPSATVAACPVKDTGSYLAGTTRYQYDNNGNLITKTAPKPNQSSTATVVTNYTYDPLNRISSKSYNDNSTPSTCYLYDSASLGIGRLGSEWTQSASVSGCAASFPPTGNYLTARSIAAYNPMGWILSEKQYTPATIATGQPYAMAYTYDLLGNLTSTTSGAAPPSMSFSSAGSCANTSPYVTTALTFSHCFDEAGHITSVSSNASIGPADMLSGAVYAAFGGITTATLGSKAVGMTRTYDSRLRITSESDLGNSPGTATTAGTTVTITGAEQSH